KKGQTLLKRLLASPERQEIIGEALLAQPDPSTHYRDFEVFYYVNKVREEMGVGVNEAAKIVAEQWPEIAEQGGKAGLEQCWLPANDIAGVREEAKIAESGKPRNRQPEPWERPLPLSYEMANEAICGPDTITDQVRGVIKPRGLLRAIETFDPSKGFRL